MSHVLSEQKRHRGLFVPLMGVLYLLGLLLQSPHVEAKTSTALSPQSYYISSYSETVDGHNYLFQERSYPRYLGTPSSSYLELPQIDVWENGHYQWSIMEGQLHEWYTQGHQYSRVDLTTSGDAPGDVHRQIQWYPDESSQFNFPPKNEHCSSTSPIHESQWGNADATYVCNPDTASTVNGDTVYDPLIGRRDRDPINAPAATFFNDATYQQWRHIQNIIDYSASPQAIHTASTIHPQSVTAVVVGCALLAAGVVVALGGSVLTNVESNQKWAKILGGVLGVLGGAVLITAGALIFGPVVGAYILTEGSAGAGAVEAAAAAATNPGASAATLTADAADYSASLRMLFRQ